MSKLRLVSKTVDKLFPKILNADATWVRHDNNQVELLLSCRGGEYSLFLKPATVSVLFRMTRLPSLSPLQTLQFDYYREQSTLPDNHRVTCYLLAVAGKTTLNIDITVDRTLQSQYYLSSEEIAVLNSFLLQSEGVDAAVSFGLGLAVSL